MKRFCSTSKARFATIIILFSFFSCEKNEPSIALISEHPIVGNWKLIEFSYSIGGSEQIIQPIEDGDEIIFNEDLTFEFDLNTDCANGGTFNLKESELLMTYKCANAKIDKEILYDVNFIGQEQIILFPMNPICIEGCSYKYERQ